MGVESNSNQFNKKGGGENWKEIVFAGNISTVHHNLCFQFLIPSLFPHEFPLTKQEKRFLSQIPTHNSHHISYKELGLK
jgi:hypothetical protein